MSGADGDGSLGSSLSDIFVSVGLSDEGLLIWKGCDSV